MVGFYKIKIPKKDLLIIGLIVLVIIEGVFFLSFWLKNKALRVEITKLKTPRVEIVKPQEFGAGEIGEISEEEVKRQGILSLPSRIFNSKGIINQVKTDRLIVQGDGTSFVDKKPRTLNVVFISETITFKPGQRIYYQGLAGLKYLKPGMRISIQGAENIRGKTEFKAKIINIL